MLASTLSRVEDPVSGSSDHRAVRMQRPNNAIRPRTPRGMSAPASTPLGSREADSGRERLAIGVPLLDRLTFRLRQLGIQMRDPLRSIDQPLNHQIQELKQGFNALRLVVELDFSWVNRPIASESQVVHCLLQRLIKTAVSHQVADGVIESDALLSKMIGSEDFKPGAQ